MMLKKIYFAVNRHTELFTNWKSIWRFNAEKHWITQPPSFLLYLRSTSKTQLLSRIIWILFVWSNCPLSTKWTDFKDSSLPLTFNLTFHVPLSQVVKVCSSFSSCTSSNQAITWCSSTFPVRDPLFLISGLSRAFFERKLVHLGSSKYEDSPYGNRWRLCTKRLWVFFYFSASVRVNS